MATEFTAGDLRALADALDALTEATRTTGVRTWGYNGEMHVQLHGQPLRASWQDGDPVAKTLDGTTLRGGGQYVVEIPDPSW
ncbi:hypothetical protein [Streptomyces roseolus]|uniref:hypothetical protein n=1 Tax=Streptomyces roseolus TaxID=67358 RepID=UPI003674734D